MLNYEITKVLVHERQNELTHNAVVARLARRVRRSRRNAIQVDATDDFSYIEIPTLATADHVHSHAVAA